VAASAERVATAENFILIVGEVVGWFVEEVVVVVEVLEKLLLLL
jgi:hypothetical protein